MLTEKIKEKCCTVGNSDTVDKQERENKVLAILPEIQQGNKEAFAEFLRLYSEDIYNYPIRFFNFSIDDAGDFYIYALEHLRNGRKLSSYQGKARFSTWFFAVLRNLTIDFLRARHNKLTEVSLTVQNAEGSTIDGLENLPERETPLHDEELMQKFDHAFQSLKLSQRVLFKLTYIYFFDLTDEEWEYLINKSGMQGEELIHKTAELREIALQKASEVKTYETRLVSHFHSIVQLEKKINAFFLENPEYPRETTLWSETYENQQLPQEILELIQSLERRRKKQIHTIEKQKRSLLNVRVPYKELAPLFNKSQGVLSVQVLRILEKINQMSV